MSIPSEKIAMASISEVSDKVEQEEAELNNAIFDRKFTTQVNTAEKEVATIGKIKNNSTKTEISIQAPVMIPIVSSFSDVIPDKEECRILSEEDVFSDNISVPDLDEFPENYFDAQGTTKVNDLRREVAEAMIKANRNVMEALQQTNRDVTEALEKANRNVKNTLNAALKENSVRSERRQISRMKTSKTNNQLESDLEKNDVLKHPTSDELVPRNAHHKKVPLNTKKTRVNKSPIPEVYEEFSLKSDSVVFGDVDAEDEE